MILKLKDQLQPRPLFNQWFGDSFSCHNLNSVDSISELPLWNALPFCNPYNLPHTLYCLLQVPSSYVALQKKVSEEVMRCREKETPPVLNQMEFSRLAQTLDDNDITDPEELSLGRVVYHCKLLLFPLSSPLSPTLPFFPTLSSFFPTISPFFPTISHSLPLSSPLSPTLSPFLPHYLPLSPPFFPSSIHCYLPIQLPSFSMTMGSFSTTTTTYVDSTTSTS